MDHLFEEISARVNDLLLEQGSHINVQLLVSRGRFRALGFSV